MKSKELIQSLAADLKPVKVLRYGVKDYASVLLAGLFSVLAGAALTGVRPDFQIMMRSPSFLIQTVILVFLAVLSTVSALQMSIPSSSKPVSQKTALATLALWTMALIYFLINANAPFAGWGFACAGKIGISSILPSTAIFLVTRSAAVLSRRASGWFILTAGAAYGALATQLSCSSTDPLHMLAWHAVPVLLIGLCGIVAATLFIKKV